MSTDGSPVEAPVSVDVRAALVQPGGRWRDLPGLWGESSQLPSILGELSRLADADGDVEVRYKAKKMLAVLRTAHLTAPVAGAPPAPPVPVAGPATIPAPGALQAALSGRPTGQKQEILRAFAQGHGRDVIDEIMQCAGREDEAEVLSQAIALVGRYGSPDHIRLLKPFLKHQSPRVVANAIEAAGSLDPGATLPMVMPMLLNEDNRIRANVLMVLWRVSRPEVLAYLSRMASSLKESYRAAAVWCMGQLEDPDIEEIVVRVLAVEESPELLAREAAILARIGTRRSIPPLHVLSETSPGRQDLAETLLREIGTREGIYPEGLAILRAQLESERPRLGVAGRIRRLTRQIKTAVLGRKALARPVAGIRGAAPAGETPSAARGPRIAVWSLAGAGALAVLALLGSAGLSRPAPDRAGVARGLPVVAGSPARSSPRPVSGSGGIVMIQGTVTAASGGQVDVASAHTAYHVTFSEPGIPAALTVGNKVRMEGRFLSWNTFQGIVNLEGRSAQVVR